MEASDLTVGDNVIAFNIYNDSVTGTFVRPNTSIGGRKTVIIRLTESGMLATCWLDSVKLQKPALNLKPGDCLVGRRPNSYRNEFGVYTGRTKSTKEGTVLIVISFIDSPKEVEFLLATASKYRPSDSAIREWLYQVRVEHNW